jgi:hypothetical protein
MQRKYQQKDRNLNKSKAIYLKASLGAIKSSNIRQNKKNHRTMVLVSA